MAPLLRSRRGWAAAIVAGLALFPVWYFTAYPRGMLAAYIDHLRGHDEVYVSDPGLPPTWEGEYPRVLKEKYGVAVKHVAGSLPLQEEWFTTGYNTVSERLLVEQY